MEVSEDDVMCLVLLNGLKLDQRTFFVVVVMNNNCISTMLPPFNYNLTFQLWQRLMSNDILKEIFFKFLKFI
jgi:hypothetical protein